MSEDLHRAKKALMWSAEKGLGCGLADFEVTAIAAYIAELEKAANWVLDNPKAHPSNIRKVIQEAIND